MAETIKIITDNKSEFNINQGSRTIDLINRLTKLDNELEIHNTSKLKVKI